MRPQTILALAASSGRVGYVYFERRQPMDWALSRKASRSPAEAAAFAKDCITKHRPDVVITEKITKRSRKGEATRWLIEAMAREAANHEPYDISIERGQHFANKYEEAETYADRFPQLEPLVPRKRRLWDVEPPRTTYFEAVALALALIDKPEG